ncbi:MAG: hypothetical protein K5739_09500 [Lachnospiraceae bacterium]|nr:hypothetical protein [Lachnospiraceae bacterium]
MSRNKTMKSYEELGFSDDFMNKGNSYKSLPESNVLFLCTFDPYQRGISRYTFKQRCEELPSLEMGDETVKIFYNCTYTGNDLPEDLRDLYNYVENGEVGNELTRKLEEAVSKGRKNEIWRSQYMKEWVIIQDAKEEGREEGRNENAYEVYNRCLARGMSDTEAREISGYLPNGSSVLAE